MRCLVREGEMTASTNPRWAATAQRNDEEYEHQREYGVICQNEHEACASSLSAKEDEYKA
jgi:hypothetical protein